MFILFKPRKYISMNLNLRKSVLLVGALASLGLSYTTEALATSPNFAVNSVQQSKKVTGNVSDAEGPIIGASVVEKVMPEMVQLQTWMVTSS